MICFNIDYEYIQIRINIMIVILHQMRIPSYFCMNQALASSSVTFWLVPILAVALLLRVTLLPALESTTQKSMPKMPVQGSYLMPRSICSLMPKPKLPVLLKFFFLSSYSLTFKPLSSISNAFSPLTVTWQAIFSFLLIPNDRIVNLAFDKTGVCPVKSSNTLQAFVSLSPLSPALMFITNFSIFISLIGLSLLYAI